MAIGGYDITMVGEEDWDISQRMAELGNISHIAEYIYHNEGKTNLWKTIKKKAYYAPDVKKYTKKSANTKNSKLQTNIIARYMLFFSKPKRLFRNPFLSLGMLFMKTCEFGAGAAALLIPFIRREGK